MSLLNVFQVAGSAMTAQAQRLNVVASNLANAESTSGPGGQPYRAKQLEFMAAALPGGRGPDPAASALQPLAPPGQ